MGQKENQQVVIELLLEHGWRPDGHTTVQKYKIITQQSYPLPGALVTQGGKPRFISPNGKEKVGVGVRTTYFYTPERGVPYYDWGGAGFKTKEPDKVHDYIHKIEQQASQERE